MYIYREREREGEREREERERERERETHKLLGLYRLRSLSCPSAFLENTHTYTHAHTHLQTGKASKREGDTILAATLPVCASPGRCGTRPMRVSVYKNTQTHT